MSEPTQQSRTNAESTNSSTRQTPAEYVERSDINVLLTVKLTRSTGTRDQDKLTAKMKAKTLEEAREDMEALREYVHDLVEDARQIQPGEDDE